MVIREISLLQEIHHTIKNRREQFTVISKGYDQTLSKSKRVLTQYDLCNKHTNTNKLYCKMSFSIRQQHWI